MAVSFTNPGDSNSTQKEVRESVKSRKGRDIKTAEIKEELPDGHGDEIYGEEKLVHMSSTKAKPNMSKTTGPKSINPVKKGTEGQLEADQQPKAIKTKDTANTQQESQPGSPQSPRVAEKQAKGKIDQSKEGPLPFPLQSKEAGQANLKSTTKQNDEKKNPKQEVPQKVKADPDVISKVKASAPIETPASPKSVRAASPPVKERVISPPAKERAISPPAIERANSPPVKEQAASPSVKERIMSPPAKESTTPLPKERAMSPSIKGRATSPHVEERAISPPVKERVMSPPARESVKGISSPPSKVQSNGKSKPNSPDLDYEPTLVKSTSSKVRDTDRVQFQDDDSRPSSANDSMQKAASGKLKSNTALKQSNAAIKGSASILKSTPALKSNPALPKSRSGSARAPVNTSDDE